MLLAAIDPWILSFSAITVLVTVWMGFRSAKTSKSASDFFVAGRSVGVGMNASAISGEYLSAASFMGVAGMVMSSGYDALWYPVCYACGYLFLLLFIAGPLRRFGAYTIPDFAEGRYDSPLFRKIAVIFVLFIGFFYTMPQMKGAGTTLAYIFPGLPYWVGVVLVGAVITLNVALGGMKGITLVQAFQYWAKMFAISVPVFVLMAVYGGYGKQLEAQQHWADAPFQGEAHFPVLANLRSYENSTSPGFTNMTLQQAVSRFAGENDFKIVTGVAGEMEAAGTSGMEAVGISVTRQIPPLLIVPELPEKLVSYAPRVGTNHIGYMRGFEEALRAAGIRFDWAGQRAIRVTQIDNWGHVSRKPLPEKAPADSTWLSPFGPLTTKATKAAKIEGEAARPYSLLYTYSLIIALVCGTAGLPHILVRFYTNPDGVAAKRTTMWVMILIGVFYVFPPVFGVMGRNLFPELYNGVGAKGTDKIVLELPRLLNEKYGVLGSVLSGITCAGAFAAFMSTFSGLLVSMTGALAHDVYGRMLRPKSTPDERMRMFKWCAVLIGAVAMLLGSFVEKLEINFMVGQAFAIAAASYFPLLFLSVWWRGMTLKGAATGMLTGGFLSVIAISLTSFTTLAAGTDSMAETLSMFKPLVAFFAAHPLLRILCEQPAIWAVPLAITLMVVVSKLTRREVPADIRMKMLVLHAPEKLGLKQEYIQEHQAGPGH